MRLANTPGTLPLTSNEPSMASFGGRHRQRGTGRLVTYWATYAASTSSVMYFGVVLDGRNLLASPEGAVSFDDSGMSPDEAARKHLGDFIDAAAFGEGLPPQRSWTDYGPYK